MSERGYWRVTIKYPDGRPTEQRWFSEQDKFLAKEYALHGPQKPYSWFLDFDTEFDPEYDAEEIDDIWDCYY